jgi:hypothetical protein
VGVKEVEQFRRGVRRELSNTDLIGMYEPPASESFQHAECSKFLVANNVGDNVFDRPAVA